MASRKPLVLVLGEFRQLQAGDVLVDSSGNVIGALATWYSGVGAPGTLRTYVSNGDANGIFYLAGQNWNTGGTWTNPAVAGYLNILRSSNDTSADSLLVDRTQNLDTKTLNVANSWMACDLGSGRTATINKYSMQLRGTNRAIRTWKLQGSNNVSANTVAGYNAATWVTLDSHAGDTTQADSAYAWGTFTPSTLTGAYRWFRILQDGTNAQGDNYLCQNEWELYGTVFDASLGSVGSNGDYYRDTSNGDIYYKSGDAWALVSPGIGVAGTTTQYRRGDNTWQTLNQAAVAGLTTADSPTFLGVTIGPTPAAGTAPTTRVLILGTNGTPTQRLLSIRSGNNQSYGFDLMLDDAVTGDLSLQRIVAGISTHILNIARASGGINLGGTADPGANKLQITNSSAPSTPSGGGIIYVESGALKYKGSSGSVTILGPA